MSTQTIRAPTRSVSRRSRREVIYRHAALVRLTHWVNAAAVFMLIGSGLNIFNAHPRLYWGVAGDQYDSAVLSIGARTLHGAVRGVVRFAGASFDTTGVLGWSLQGGRWTARAWPAWITLPSFTDLADARHWHFLFAWVLAANGVVYLAWTLASRHLHRDLLPTREDLRGLPRSALDHLRLRHPVGDAARRYNVLQKLAYLGVGVLIGGMVATGLCMSPGIDALAPWLPAAFGGRQSARTLHFAFAVATVGFIFVHVVEVVLAGPVNELRSMITGRYALPRAGRTP